MAKAARSLRRRDLSETELAVRLARSGVPPAARADAVDRLVRAGAVDDERFARTRADVLAERGAGDLLVRHDLAGRGLSEEQISAAIAELEPELMRAERIVAQRGLSLRTARYLARKGFSTESIESACEQGIAEDAPPAVR
jgi:regulatory protein